MKIDKGAIMITGVSMKFDGWILISGLNFNVNFKANEAIRIE